MIQAVFSWGKFDGDFLAGEGEIFTFNFYGNDCVCVLNTYTGMPHIQHAYAKKETGRLHTRT